MRAHANPSKPPLTLIKQATIALSAMRRCRLVATSMRLSDLYLGHGRRPRQHWNGPMYRELTQREIDRIIKEAHARRAGAFGRMISGMFKR